MQIGTPPWHMWGSEQTVNLTVTSLLLPTANKASPQLASVNYKRPDTWEFFFVGQVLRASSTAGPGSGSVTVDFELTFGVGRNTTKIPSFMRFQWDINNNVGKQIFSSVAPGPTRTTTPADAVANLINEFPAQTIQLVANCIYQTGVISDVDLTVGAYFAPKTHVRPDWMKLRAEGREQFQGGEDGGK